MNKKDFIWPATAIICALILALGIASHDRWKHASQYLEIDSWTGSVCALGRAGSCWSPQF